VLSAILHCRADISEVNALLEESDFFTKLDCQYPDDPPHEFTIPGDPYPFVSGLMSIHGALSKSWAFRLLTTPKVVIEDKFCSSDGIAKLQKGLLLLHNSSQLQIKNGLVKSQLSSQLERQMRKMQKDSTQKW